MKRNREAFRSHGVRRLGLFGSYARGEARKVSDLDFVPFGCPVDLVLADTVKPRLRSAILEDAIHSPGL